MTFNRSHEIPLSECLKVPNGCRLLAMFKINLEKHIKCIKMCNLWTIVCSVISRAPWRPGLSTGQICVAIYYLYSEHVCQVIINSDSSF